MLAGPTETETFTLRIHYGGHFTEFNREYLGGEVVHFDYVSVDYLNLLELNEIAKLLKVVFPYWLWYKPYGDDLFYLIEKDEETLKFDKALSPEIECELYFGEVPDSFKPLQALAPAQKEGEQSKQRCVEAETISDEEGDFAEAETTVNEEEGNFFV